MKVNALGTRILVPVLLLLSLPWFARAAPRPSTSTSAQESLGAVARGDTQILEASTIPKYVIPLVIAPLMEDDGAANSYDIAVRQFEQQILPGGIWNTITGRNDHFKPTTVWGYGPAADPVPAVAPDPTSQFNYPAYTIETPSGTPVHVRWINDLVDKNGKYRPHLLPVDQTLHWANPPAGPGQTDSMGFDDDTYTGPVPS